MQEKNNRKAKAIVVGIDNYEQANKLDNAVNDAKGMAEAFRKLGFYVDDYLDIVIDDWDLCFRNFCANLDQFQVCVFYFAGHGVEIDGKNYLLCKDTPADSSEGTKRYSIDLQSVIDTIKKFGCQVCIYMIDACRINPFSEGRAGYASVKLAPIFAPKGTLIAYSTSPGEPASDKGVDNHSYYTYALLEHIFELGLPVESFFKKVRTTVYNLTGGKKTSWEHTSLIGNFCFNSGQLVQDLNTGNYSISVIRRDDYDYSDAQISDIIGGFFSTQFNDQRVALKRMKALVLNSLNKDQMFILGRSCMWAAVYECWDCQKFFDDRSELVKYTIKNDNHFLNGALFELYFNENGIFSSGSVNVKMLDKVICHCRDEKLKFSFDYINRVLQPFSNQLLFMPSSTPEFTSIDVTLKEGTYQEFRGDVICLVVSTIRHDTMDLTKLFAESYNKTFNSINELKNEISAVCHIPNQYTKVNCNLSKSEIGKIQKIIFDDNMLIEL